MTQQKTRPHTSIAVYRTERALNLAALAHHRREMAHTLLGLSIYAMAGRVSAQTGLLVAAGQLLLGRPPVSDRAC